MAFDIEKMEREAAIKRELMELEFSMNMRLRSQELDIAKSKDTDN